MPLPAQLDELINAVKRDAVGYAGREQDAKQLSDYLEGGDHSMAQFKATKMIELQQQYRAAMEHGLPLHLQALIDQVNAERIGYAGREQDTKQLSDYLEGGDHTMAEFKAMKMIELQQQYRAAMEHGLPQHLQALIDQVNAEQIGYAGREQDAKQLSDYLEGGDHSMAEFKATKMIELQQQYRAAMEHGLPQHLQALIDQVNAEQIGYAGREQDAKQLSGYLEGGDHSMAEFKATKMIELQQQYRAAMEHGLPHHLQALIDQVNAERIGYIGREQDAKQLSDYLEGGDHSMAEFKATKMIELQRNIRDCNTKMA